MACALEAIHIKDQPKESFNILKFMGVSDYVEF